MKHTRSEDVERRSGVRWLMHEAIYTFVYVVASSWALTLASFSSRSCCDGTQDRLRIEMILTHVVDFLGFDGRLDTYLFRF